jgi:hypothetical protein
MTLITVHHLLVVLVNFIMPGSLLLDHLVLSFGLGVQLLDVPCSHVTVAVIKLIMVSPPMDSSVALLLLISARTMQIPMVIQLRLVASLIFIRSRTECTLRPLCSVRGRIRHYCVCIRHMLPLVPIFSAVLGTEGKLVYDGIVQLPHIIAVPADHLLSVVNTYPPAGQPF